MPTQGPSWVSWDSQPLRAAPAWAGPRASRFEPGTPAPFTSLDTPATGRLLAKGPSPKPGPWPLACHCSGRVDFTCGAERQPGAAALELEAAKEWPMCNLEYRVVRHAAASATNGRSISIYLTRNLSIYPPIHLSVHLTMYRPIDLPARPFACTSMGLSVSVCLPVCVHAWLLLRTCHAYIQAAPSAACACARVCVQVRCSWPRHCLCRSRCTSELERAMPSAKADEREWFDCTHYP